MLENLRDIDVKTLSHEQLLQIAHDVKEAQSIINFNEYIQKKHKPTLPADTIKIPKPPVLENGIRYRSWFEMRMFEQGPLQRLDYEPFKINYITEHSYTPDFAIPNTNILGDLKGAMQNKEEAAKFINILKQHNVALLFIFQRRDIELWWRETRKDGTRLTHEQWCDFHAKKGLPIYYTFEDEADQYFRSKEFKEIYKKHLIKNVA